MTAAAYLPEQRSLAQLRDAVQGCRGCDLYKNATQVVFGEGPGPAPLMLMGEVPGDKEDKAGHPFVGPAGKILDDALTEVGIDRSLVYLTNAVKHFKWVPARGGIQLSINHLDQRRDDAQVVACHLKCLTAFVT